VVESWYTEASTVLDLDGRPQPLLAGKQTAEITVGADGFTRLSRLSFARAASDAPARSAMIHFDHD
jgi:hypothetical protein